MQDLARYSFNASLISFPDRGPWGNPRYHGNCSGHVVRGFLATYHPDRNALFVDPMEGSGTSRDVATELGVRYAGFDLREGFDLTRHDLRTVIDDEAASIFLHPPYGGMVAYSGNVWGKSQSDADLSSFGTDVDAFTDLLQAAPQNAHAALGPRGHYAVLLGAWRKAGTYYDLPYLARRLAPGDLVDVIIKAQHNTRSGERQYNGSFVPIQHETMLVFRRKADASIFAVTADALDTLTRAHTSTWRNLVLGFVREHGNATLADLYAAFERHPRTRTNPNYRAKLRQVVQDERTFTRLARGRYAAPA